MAHAVLEYAFGEFPVHPGDRPFQEVDRDGQLRLFGRICEVDAAVAAEVEVVVLWPATAGRPRSARRCSGTSRSRAAPWPSAGRCSWRSLMARWTALVACCLHCSSLCFFLSAQAVASTLFQLWGGSRLEVKAGRGHWLFLLSWPQSGWDIWRRGDTSLLAMIVARWMILSSSSRMCAGMPPAHGGMLATCFSSGQ